MTHAQSSRSRLARRVSFALLSGLLLVMAAAGSVMAAPPSLIRESSSFAVAYDSGCIEHSDGTLDCHYVSLYVSSHGSSWEVCGFRYADTFPVDGEPLSHEESGCATVTGDMFTLDRKLLSATLEPVTVMFFTYTCDSSGCEEGTREGTLAGEWSGYGNLIRINDRFSVHDGKCKYTYSGKGERRDATAVIVFDGNTINSSDAHLGTSRTSFKTSTECV